MNLRLEARGLEARSTRLEGSRLEGSRLEGSEIRNTPHCSPVFLLCKMLPRLTSVMVYLPFRVIATILCSNSFSRQLGLL